MWNDPEVWKIAYGTFFGISMAVGVLVVFSMVCGILSWWLKKLG